MRDPRPHDLISTNELLYFSERARRTPYKDMAQALRRAMTTIDYYEVRLEVRTKDHKLLPESCDGIACRDETIKLLDARVRSLNENGKAPVSE